MLGAIVVAAALWLVAVDVAYARRYFFLFDDFALVGQASEVPVRELLTVPHFGFLRPAVFLLTRLEFRAFSWQHPAGYLAVSLLIHALSAALLFWILRRFGLARVSAAAGAVLFAASPWATEATFWVSGRFDLLSAFATLGCAAAMLVLAADETRPRAMLFGAAAFFAACVAFLSKENAVAALPVFVVTVVAARYGARGRGLRWVAIAAMAVAACGYLLFRNRVLPGFGGAYGTAGVLFARTPVLAHVLAYVRAFATVPMPGVVMGTPPGQAATLLIAAATVLVAALAWLRHRGLATAAIAGFAAAIAPTLWAPPIPFATQPGRFMYLPGVCACLLFAAAIDFLGTRGRAARISGVTFAAAVFAAAGVSVLFQASVWARATAMARDGIEQFRPLVGSGVREVFISNLPSSFGGGPFVLKDYAFDYYFHGAHGAPAVKARLMALEVDGDGSRFLGWIGDRGVGGAAFPPPVAASDRVLTLRLAVAGMPSPAEVEPSHVSVFVARGAGRMSDARIAVTALTPWRAEPSNPALLAVEPARGPARGSFRIVPLAGDAPVDRVETVVIRAEPDGAELATVAVRVRVGETSGAAPPFGSVDLPTSHDVSARQPGPLMFQGWALDEFGLRRVYGRATDADGTSVTLGDARREGERADVSRLFPAAHDLFRAAWILPIDVTRLGRLPIVVEVFAEDTDGLTTRLGARTIR